MSGRSLAARFRRLIAQTGPITVQHYMGEANAHYYANRDPLGAAGDFTTAPEISQMFGEMIGACLADGVRRSNHSGPVHYVELGPGRGTLAADALRVLRKFGVAAYVHLVEGSPALRAIQGRLLGDVTWHADLSSVPEHGPLLIVANEFFDALPVRQLVRTEAGWRERMVALEGDRFIAIAGDRPMDAAVPEPWREAAPGAIIETCPAAAAIAGELARRLAGQGGVALLIDYGYATSGFGSSLQAVRAHQKADPLAEPGTADLTALVDFSALAVAAATAEVLGPVGQGHFLRALGIESRAAALAQAAPERSAEVAAALARLTGAEAMGELFKVMALVGAGWPRPAGFSSP
jgi:NADH dehydrogenase [ubiquinone] 1 alpha subcomplex assembly factor 7